MVLIDAVGIRETAWAPGLPFATSRECARQVAAAKKMPERLGEVSSVVLQEFPPDLDSAYKHFFGGLQGKRPDRCD
ncbi:hypothetical protein [Streptomyces virginiae]|uniref:hypothetical protein n=1 Tax=Streptomyces virginiae TaxID=1961 RepID=UPI00069E209A|nr:hypothetical protein [Streptomyces virginiae]